MAFRYLDITFCNIIYYNKLNIKHVNLLVFHQFLANQDHHEDPDLQEVQDLPLFHHLLVYRVHLLFPLILALQDFLEILAFQYFL